MTLHDVIITACRRWYVVVVVFAAAAALFAAFLHDAGVYSTRTSVSFTLFQETALTPDNSTSNESVIAFAGTVASTINRRKPAVRYSTAEAPYYGAGLREGVLVGLRDEGSQWAPSYGSAVIEIQIVGKSHEWVQETQESILTQVSQFTEAQQLMVGARPEQQIVARVEPLTLPIQHITPSTTAIAAALAAMFVCSLLVAAWAAVIVDNLINAKPDQRGSKLGKSHITFRREPARGPR